MSKIDKFLKKQAYNVYYGIGDPDHPPCPICGDRMEFHGGRRKAGNGYWDCPSCDFTFTETDLSNVDF